MQNEPKKIFNRIGLAMFVITVAVNLIQALMAGIIQAVAPAFQESGWYIYCLILISFYLVGAPLFFLLVRNLPATAHKERKPLKIRHFLCLFIMCLGSMYIFNYVGIFINYALGILIGNVNLNPLNTMIGGTAILPTILFAGIASPVVEELVFRKILLERLRNYGDAVAILVSGLCFGLYHGNIAQFLYATVLGFIFAYVVIRTGDIRYSILLHICINILGTVLFPQLITKGMAATLIIALVIILSIALTILFYILALTKKKLKFEKGSTPLEQPFKTIFLNVGMILFLLISIASFVLVLFTI